MHCRKAAFSWRSPGAMQGVLQTLVKIMMMTMMLMLMLILAISELHLVFFSARTMLMGHRAHPVARPVDDRHHDSTTLSRLGERQVVWLYGPPTSKVVRFCFR